MIFTHAHLGDILTANWPAAARLIAWVRALVGAPGETLPKHLLYRARRLLRPAESLIRRLIVIMACRVVLPQDLSSRTRRASAADPGPFHRKPRTPSLILGPTEPIRLNTEPFPKIAPFSFPGIWSPGMVRYTPPTPEELAATPLPAGGLFARLAKLEAVLAAPDAAAVRLARWIARQRAALKAASKPVRTQPVLPPGMMPGRACGLLDKLMKDRLTYTAAAAHAALGGEVIDTS